ncbi:NAD-dependent epimerase/dehydratase family protein [Tessaracoccus caeni]|uniref:NAD-dependent epimerase/dehydratase family protein n=1 Tax=Tessaracoccus caeni TaxID=3031239 RepID=UPI0023DB8DED|nr:NAD-dependent epimerase/dehydratase family protein [Tessaracoccus caeni]MDF1487360.1 NAD-dependent epimerase/dehydratase family protein [Tessaracoccus caeni]
MNASLWSAIGIAAAVALVAPFLLRPVLGKVGAFDVPNHRSSHSRPTLRGGGIAPLLGFVIGGGWAIFALSGSNAVSLAVVVAAALVMGLVGLTEDLGGLRVVVRAGLQFLVGGVAAGVFFFVDGAGWLWLPLAALFFAAHVNFTNFMDGVNAISGLHGLVVGLSFAALGVVQGLTWLVVAGLLIAVAFSAFVPWNLIPPGMFLGDVGSYLLGSAVAVTAIGALTAGVHPVAALAPVAIYWADTVFTLFRRVLRGEAVFEPHRSHVYQRLTNTGLSHVAVAVLVALFTAAVSGVGIFVARYPQYFLLGALVILAICGCYLGLARMRGDVPPAPLSHADLTSVPLPRRTAHRTGWEPRRWAVLGGSGFIGSAMAQHLREQGYEVRALKAPRLELDPDAFDGADVARMAGELPEVAQLAAALAGVDVVINAAGLATPDGQASKELYGANALLPAVVIAAAAQAGCGRVVHLSSAAVQGDRPVLDASPDVSPFSPYSRSKALGERGFLVAAGRSQEDLDCVIVRATSVQGPDRPTTVSLRAVAKSPLASVAAPGTYPTVVSSVSGLVTFVRRVGESPAPMPSILLQPWEGLTVREVLEYAGGRRPLVLPRWLCRTAVICGKAVGRVSPRIAGVVRRVELMWFGQRQEQAELAGADIGSEHVREALAGRSAAVSANLAG